LTSNRPKCMMKIAGKFLLEYQIRAFSSTIIKKFIIIVGYEAGKIKKRYERNKTTKQQAQRNQ